MNKTMKAIAMTDSMPIEKEESLVLVTVPIPQPGSTDLLVRVKATSINPVDTKVRSGWGEQKEPKILGWDAAGIVEAIGEDVTGFDIGDEVYYAGDITRAGSDAQYQTVDYRLVAHKPSSLNFEEAAAIPLTAITAWETLFDHMGLTEKSTGNLLVMGGAGGVGSMVIQLAKARTSLNVIASASREESIQWCQQMGADQIVNHHDFATTVQEAGGADYVFSAYTEGKEEELAQAMNTRGQLVFIDDPVSLKIADFKTKSISITPEFMFTRSMFETPDMGYQGKLLQEVASMLDNGDLQGTAQEYLSGLSVDTFRRGHQMSETSRTVGKIVISY